MESAVQIGFDDSEKKPITFDEVEALCASIVEQRKTVESIRNELKEANATLDSLESKLINLLHELGKDSYASKVGKFIIHHRLSVRVPQGDNRIKFFEYLKQRGIFEDMITVNSNTLNAWYKQEFERAKENGTLLDFKIDGLDEPTIVEVLHYRKE